MGFTNLAHTLRLASKRDRKERQEIDLIASHSGKVLVLDLKLGSQSEDLSTRQSLIPQIRRAADNRQRLAGLSAQMVLVRPCRLFDENERDLAKTYGVDVIDQRDAPRLFSRLAGYLKLSPLPAEMEAVEALLVQQIAERGRVLVFGADYERLRQQAADSGGPEWVDLEGYLNRVRIERGQNWLLWANRTEIVLRLDRPANAPDELPTLIQSALSNFGRVRVESTANGYEAIFPREASRLAKLRQALAGFVNRRLETMVFVQVRPAGPVKAPERPVKSIISPSYHKGGTGSLEDLDAAFDQVLPPKSPGRKT